MLILRAVVVDISRKSHKNFLILFPGLRSSMMFIVFPKIAYEHFCLRSGSSRDRTSPLGKCDGIELIHAYLTSSCHRIFEEVKQELSINFSWFEELDNVHGLPKQIAYEFYEQFNFKMFIFDTIDSKSRKWTYFKFLLISSLHVIFILQIDFQNKFLLLKI